MIAVREHALGWTPRRCAGALFIAAFTCAAGAQCPVGPLTSLFPTGATTFHQQGYSVSLANLGDGTLLALTGDSFFGASPLFLSGAAFVFRGTPDGLGGYSWSQESMLRASDAAANDIAGDVVAMHVVDGQAVALVGSQKDDHAQVNAGSVAVFRRSAAGAWTQEAQLIAPDVGANDFFGNALAMDGGTAIVGCREDQVGPSRTGSAYFFGRVPAGMGFSWSFQTKIAAPDGTAGAWFGHAVAIAGDWAAIGAPRDDQAGSNAGAVYLFRRTGPGAWEYHSKLTAPAALTGENFGFAVAMEGQHLLAGAPHDDGGGVGRALVYRRDEDGMGGWTWSLEMPLEPEPGGGVNGDRYGEAVSLRDGLALIGASGEADPGADAGSAYLFRRAGSELMPEWIRQSKIRLLMPAATDAFGWTVSLSRGWMLIGAPAHSQYGPNWGNAFVTAAPTAPLIIAAPADESIMTGDTLRLDVAAAGRAPWTIQWFRDETMLIDDARISGSTEPTLMVSDVTTTDAGTYRVEITNDCGTAEASAEVSIAPPAPCPGDANGDRIVNFADVTSALANFGMSYGKGTGPGDADGNGLVNFADVTSVLANFDLPCP